jgi:hypothetical protein
MDTSTTLFVAPPSGGALPANGRAQFGQGSASALSMKWSALHDAANVVAALAGLAAEPPRPDLRNFPAVVRDAGGWRRELAEQSVDDMSAIMEPGIAALLAAHARGADASAAALALWQEFHSARNALLELLPPAGPLGPQRSA